MVDSVSCLRLLSPTASVPGVLLRFCPSVAASLQIQGVAGTRTYRCDGSRDG